MTNQVHGPVRRGLGAVLGGAITLAIAIPIVVATIAALLVYFVYFHGPRERDSPSFHYGEKIMQGDVYGSLTDGSVGGACRDAIDNAADLPKHLDVAEAVSGCKYAEYILDN